MGLYHARAKYVPYIWHVVKPLIHKVITNTDDSLIVDDYMEMLMKSDVELWIGLDDEEFSGDFKALTDDDIKMIVVSEVTPLPRTKVLQILVWCTKSGRDYQHWMDQFGTIEDYGRDHGCVAVTAIARKGLAKKLHQLSGWKEESILLSKDL